MYTSLFEESYTGLYFVLLNINRTINLSFIHIECRIYARIVLDRTGISIMLKILMFQRRLR